MALRAFHFLLGLIVMIGSGARALSAQDTRSYTLQGPRYEIQVYSVVPFKTSSGSQIYLLDYAYTIQDARQVYVASLGLAPASARFRYFSAERKLEILDSKKTLASVLLRPTDVARASDPVDFPGFRDFASPALRSGNLSYSEPFSVRATRLLNFYFTSGYDPDEIRSNVHYYITSYRNLDLNTRNLVGQIAIMLSNPEPVADSLAFRVRWLLREKNRFDPDWRPPGSETTKAAEAFIAELIEKLSQ